MPSKWGTAQRGYGNAHKRARAAALANLTDGQPCAECARMGVRHPMWRAAAANLDLSHTPDRTGYIGLSWRSCNRAEGAVRRNRARGYTSTRHTPATPTPAVTEYRHW